MLTQISSQVEAEVDMEDASDMSDASDADITEEDPALRDVAQDAKTKQQTFESNKRLKKSIQPVANDKGSQSNARAAACSDWHLLSQCQHLYSNVSVTAIADRTLLLHAVQLQC